jgi:hypothetical protein
LRLSKFSVCVFHKFRLYVFSENAYTHLRTNLVLVISKPFVSKRFVTRSTTFNLDLSMISMPFCPMIPSFFYYLYKYLWVLYLDYIIYLKHMQVCSFALSSILFIIQAVLPSLRGLAINPKILIFAPYLFGWKT